MLKTTHFRAFGQLVGGAPNLVFMCFVMDKNDLDLGELPNQFTVDGVKLPPTIYTGTYPQLKLNPETILEREDLKGMGIAGIVTDECVFSYKNQFSEDYLKLLIK